MRDVEIGFRDPRSDTVLRTIACRFDAEQIAAIAALARDGGMSFAAAVRTLVELGLDAIGDDEEVAGG